MIGSGDDGRWRNKRRRHTIDGAPVSRGGRMRTMRTGRGLRGTTIVGDVSQQWAVARHEAKADGKRNGTRVHPYSLEAAYQWLKPFVYA